MKKPEIDKKTQDNLLRQIREQAKIIEEQKKAINKLDAENFQLKNLIDNLPGDIYWKDKDGIWSGVNKRGAQSLLQIGSICDRSDVIGKSDYQLFSKKTADEYRKNDLDVMKLKTEMTREEVNQLPNGEKIIQLSTKRPLWDKEGNVVGVVGNTIDISYLKKIETELKTAIDKAEIANQAKTEFIANMSHDIRTPLSGVVGLGGIVENEINDPKTKSKVHDMVKSADELLKMLNEILDVVSMDSISVKDIQSEPFDLAYLVQTIIDLEKSSIDLKKIQLLQKIDANIPSILIGDHKKIHHILLNLVGNAIKFTQNGYVSIDIKLSQVLTDAVELIFQVSDTGIGISKEELNKVFELFYKVTPSYKGLGKGHGVGLHIVKTYTELLGGKIYVESELNKGSIFSFSLILKVANENIQPQNIINTSAIEISKEPPLLLSTDETISTLPQNSPQILVIEDNDISRTIAKTLIEQAKCIPTVAVDGETGLMLAKTKNFNLIITDIGLPGISGIEFTQQFRDYEQKNNKNPTPIIALTAHADGQFYNDCINAGTNAVIIKPINSEIINKLFSQFSINSQQDISSKNTNKKLSINAELDLPESNSELFKIEHEMIFDIEDAKKILGESNTNLLMTLMKDTICKIIPKELPRLKAAHDAGQWQTVADVSHKLKGGFLSIGFNRAAIACKYLERYHKTGKTELLEKLYQQLVKTLEITSKTLLPYTK